MNQLIRRIVSWVKRLWVWKQYNVWAKCRVPFDELRKRGYNAIEPRKPDFKLVPIPSHYVTEMVFGEQHTFLAPSPLIDLDGRLIVATNHGDRMLRRIVRVERPPIEGAIWTAVIETVGAPKDRRATERHCYIHQSDYAKLLMLTQDFGIHSYDSGKCSNLMVIPFDSLVRGYKLVEATKSLDTMNNLSYYS